MSKKKTSNILDVAITILFIVIVTVNNSSSLSFYKFVAIYPNGAHTDISTLYRTKTCIGLIPNGSTTVYEDRCFSYSADDSYRLLFFQNDVDVMLDMQAFSRLLLDGIFVYFIPALSVAFLCFSFCIKSQSKQTQPIIVIIYSLCQFATASILTVCYIRMKNTIIPGLIQNHNQLFRETITAGTIQNIDCTEMDGFKCLLALLIMIWISAPFNFLRGLNLYASSSRNTKPNFIDETTITVQV